MMEAVFFPRYAALPAGRIFFLHRSPKKSKPRLLLIPVRNISNDNMAVTSAEDSCSSLPDVPVRLVMMGRRRIDRTPNSPDGDKAVDKLLDERRFSLFYQERSKLCTDVDSRVVNEDFLRKYRL